MRWEMVVDLNLCIGCNSCVIACKAENGTPPGIFWMKVLEKEEGAFPFARRRFWPVPCMHCDDPPCVAACPTGATYQREDGIVLNDGEKCVGCGACIVACPYEARSIWDEKKGYFGDVLTPYESKAYQAHVPGAVQKCVFCVDHVEQGLKPACVQTCITGCLMFGDLDDPDSEVSQALRGPRARLKLREELGVRPSVFYLM